MVHRSDGSGTSYIFTDYLSKVSRSGRKRSEGDVGELADRPRRQGQRGGDRTGEADRGRDRVCRADLRRLNELPYADVKNASGQSVTPNLKSVTAAAASAKFPTNTDFRVSITNAPGADAYPIASFTWLLVRPKNPDAAKSKAIKDFIKWMMSPEAQQMAADLKYAPLPVPLIELLEQRPRGGARAKADPIA